MWVVTFFLPFKVKIVDGRLVVLIIQYAPRQLTLSWQMEAVLSGVKINGSNTRLLYWCHGVDGRFVLQESELEREKKISLSLSPARASN